MWSAFASANIIRSSLAEPTGECVKGSSVAIKAFEDLLTKPMVWRGDSVLLPQGHPAPHKIPELVGYDNTFFTVLPAKAKITYKLTKREQFP